MHNLTDTSMAEPTENVRKATQEGVKKARKRFTRADHQAHEELIIEAVKNKQSLKLLARKLSLSDRKMSSYIRDLTLSHRLSFDGYDDNVVTKEKLLTSIKHLLGVQDDIESLFSLEQNSDGSVIVRIAE